MRNRLATRKSKGIKILQDIYEIQITLKKNCRNIQYDFLTHFQTRPQLTNTCINCNHSQVDKERESVVIASELYKLINAEETTREWDYILKALNKCSEFKIFTPVKMYKMGIALNTDLCWNCRQDKSTFVHMI